MKRLIILICLLTARSAFAQPVWQQRVDTKIDVTLDDKKHFLHAFEEFTYTNNSPDTLSYLYIHLWPNAYKNDRTPFARQLDINGSTAFYYSKPYEKGYIDSLQFMIDGQFAEYNSADNAPDIARLELHKPLLPGQKIVVSTPFRVKIPKVFSRMGHNKQAYYISQWFPKPAVYDTKGWHPISYLDQGEFFSEYGSYDVSITLPANYVLMATGNCLDEKENLWLDNKAKQPLPTEKYSLNNEVDSFPKSAAELKTVRFHEDNVHDFAWFADKRWLVQKDTVYSPGNNQLVTTWTAFMPSYWQLWKKGNDHLKETVKHYGKWVGPYQYKTIKAVLGDLKAGGGMEYPTITVIDKASSQGLRTVLIHEAGHNWFYGMLGSNERDHAWMDEGINTFYEQKTTRDLNKDTSRHMKVRKKGMQAEAILYYAKLATHDDQAIDQTSANFEKLNYGIDVYYKTTLGLNWLEKYMGDKDFEAGMHDYYDTWHFHHPYPDDMRVCLQRHTTLPLDWFFSGFLKTDEKIDFLVPKVETDDAKTEVTIRNNADLPLPALIEAYNGDSLVAHSWTLPFEHNTTLSLPVADWTTIKIDDNIIPDGKRANDEYRKRALFHHFGVKVKPFFGLNLDHKDKLFIAPALGYNQYDGIMAGLLFHNLTIPENRFRFALAPMYSFETKSFVGAGSVGYLWYPDNLFKEIMLQGDGKTFHDNETFVNLPSRLSGSYTKLAPSLTFTFNERDALSSVKRTLLIKGYSIMEQNIAFGPDSLSKPSLAAQTKMYGLLRYTTANNRTYNPFSYVLEGQMGADYAKISAEGNLRIDYNVKNKALYIRAFVGKFFAINADPAIYSRYELNASYTGLDDYLYDGTYFGRNAQNKVDAQQISIQEGGFKVPAFNNVDRSDNYMATINLETDLPLRKLPIRLFFDAGIIPNASPTIEHPSNNTIMYDGGVEVHLIKNVVSLYIPIIMSSDFDNYIINTYGKKNLFARSVSFTMQFQNINWLKAPSKVFKAVSN